ncbi:hypothetical protein H0A66_11235 [Alcaligenaceae bacterium]|nr:hypothetical protein [Alcaligenaceae bacterium]
MKTYHSPSGRQRGLDLLIDSDWSPEQAMAVLDLLDELRDRIWAHYELALFKQYRKDRITEVQLTPPSSDPPF